MIGENGYVPQLQLVTLIDGDEILDVRYIEGNGSEPTIPGYLTETGVKKSLDNALNIRGIPGPGTTGVNGWTPVLSIASDGARRVFQVADWSGGTGDKPASGEYLGDSGLVESIGDATDCRGVADGTNDFSGPDSVTDESLVKHADSSGNTCSEVLSISSVESLLTKLGYMTFTGSVDLDTLGEDAAANTAKVSNATHTGEVTGSTTLTIGDDVVTSAKLENSGVVAGDYLAANLTVNQKGLVTSAASAEVVSVQSPTGITYAYGGASAPSGWLLCDGSAVSRATYSDLFGAIGTVFGAGDGSTTFNLPDMTGRIAAGYDGTGTLALSDTLGAAGGSATHTLTTAEIPAHTHSYTRNSTSANSAWAQGYQNGDTPYQSSSTTNSTGGGDPHNNVQPTIILNHIIKT